MNIEKNFKLKPCYFFVLLCSFFSLAFAQGENEVIPYEGGVKTDTLQAGGWLYYNVTIPAHSEGLKVTLESDGTGGDPDLHLKLGADPDLEGINFKDSTGKDFDVLYVNDVVDHDRVYHVGVHFPDAAGTSNFTLKTHGAFYESVLPWDNGLTLEGEAVENIALSEGLYYYKIVARAPVLGVWRTAFTINSGEANLFVAKGVIPSTATENGKDSYALNNAGSKGFTRPMLPTAEDEVWYILVEVAPGGVEGKLVAGNVYVEDLGDLASFDSAASSPTGGQVIPPEGVRFYKTSVPSASLGWRLWLKTEDGSATWEHEMYLRKGLLPHSSSSSYYDLIRSGQALFVPTYQAPGKGGFLEPGNGEFYYVGIFGSPNESFLLDSRQQEVTDIGGLLKGGSELEVAVDATSGFHYKTYKVDVDSEIRAWGASIAPSGVAPLGDPNLCLRQGAVSNNFNNDAFSEALGADITDSVSLTGVNGVYYITTYSESAYKGVLKVKEPDITLIKYATAELDPNNPANHFTEVSNDQVNLSGWRYYQVENDAIQLSSLGWILELANQEPNTKIAIRRNNVPSGVTYRRDESERVKTLDEDDASSILGALQHRDHASDTWYIGIYTPNEKLGAFTLKSGHEYAEILDMNTGSKLDQTIAPDRWVFYRVHVPSSIPDQDGAEQQVLGWEVKINHWSGGASPEMIIRQNLLASDSAPKVKKSGNTWEVGELWEVYDEDWTHRPISSDGLQDSESFGATIAMGQPLKGGYYYVGIHNTSAEEDLTFSFTSKAVGLGMNLEPQPLSFEAGSVLVENLPSRQVRYFYVDIAEETPSWRISLENTVGEHSLYLRQGWIPTSEAASNDGSGNASPFNIDYRGYEKRTNLVRLQKVGNDSYTLMPEKPYVTNPQDPVLTGEYLPAGRYYLMIVSEGVLDPDYPERIGSGETKCELKSHGVLEAPTNLGVLSSSSEMFSSNDSYAEGQLKQYTFTVGSDVKALEVSLENRVGNPKIYGLYLVGDDGFPNGGDYGYYSGRLITAKPYSENGGGSETLIIQNNATQLQTWRMVVMDSGDENEVSTGAYKIKIRSIPTETPIDFDSNSTVSISGIAPGAWSFYKVEVPEKALDSGGVLRDVLGWELKVASWSGPEAPKMVICRGSLPVGDVDSLPKMTNSLKTGLSWDAGSQWLSYLKDWTGRPNSFDGSKEDESFGVTLAMGQPLEPGTYYIGFFNPYEYLPSEHDGDPISNFTCDVSFTSKGIGEGLQITPQKLPFDMLSPNAEKGEVSNLPAREVAYFYVDVPQGKASWKVALKATAGETSLYMRQNWIPTSEAVSKDGASDGSPYCAIYYDQNDEFLSKEVDNLVRLQKEGDEVYVLRPKNGEIVIPAGRYYLMIVSEGVVDANKPDNIGSGSSSAELTTYGEVDITHLVVPEGGIALTQEYEYGKGNVNFHSFEIPAGVTSVQIYMENRVGNPWMYGMGMAARQTGDPVTFVHGGLYGYHSGYDVKSYGDSSNNLLTVTPADPTRGSVVTLAVMDSAKAENLESGRYKFRVVTLGTESLAFDGGIKEVSDLGNGEWIFYKVVIPDTIESGGVSQDVLGWEIKIASWASVIGSRDEPLVFIRRGLTPQDSRDVKKLTLDSDNWPLGDQLELSNKDWTNRYKSADGTQSAESYGATLAIGQPLEPGTYIVGVYNEGDEPMDFSLTSKAVGVGMSLPPEPLGFSATADVVDLPARQVKYFYVDVPENKKNWSISLDTTSGESSIYLRQGWIPVSKGAIVGSAYEEPYSFDYRGNPIYSNVVKLQKSGLEYYTLTPMKGYDFIPSGRYYFMVVSEGQSPASTKIGTGMSSSTLTTHGEAQISDLGEIAIGQSSNLAVSYKAGELGLVTFQIPEGSLALEVKLIGREGNPQAWLEWRTSKFPETEAYGLYSPERADKKEFVRYTIGNPAPGSYQLVISDPSATSPRAGSYTLVVSSILPQPLHFSADENGEGDEVSNQATGSLADNERAFYKVEIPDLCFVDEQGNPTSVLGWRLEITATNGNPEMRVASGGVPTDLTENGSNLTAWTRYSLIVAPQEFHTGTWYVEVKGVGSLSEYTITSSPVTLDRPSWQMIKPGELSSTPGVLAPYFADTGVDENGDALPGDQGVDLVKGGYHFYAIDIPEGNGGLLRIQLDAISGNPDFYIRRGFIPTIDHESDGDLAYQFSLNETDQTEYGNFTVKDGKSEVELASGNWYVAVKAEGDVTARYRLRLSIGQVDDLALDGGSANNQALAAGDLRYYKLEMPDDPKLIWTVTYTASSGEVEMFIRDSLPPGQYQSGTRLYVADWSRDRKNNLIPSARDISSHGTYSFSHPALRPGHTYYIGIRAKLDASFNVTSTVTQDASIGVITPLAFEDGSLELDIAPYQTLYYKVDVPKDAIQFKSFYELGDSSKSVQIRIEQGSLPVNDDSKNAHLVKTGKSFIREDLIDSSWPWVPGQTYYIAFKNTGGVDQPITFSMEGKMALTYPVWAENSGLPVDPLLANQDNNGNGVIDLFEYALYPQGSGNIYAISETVENDDGTRSLRFYIPDEIRSGKTIYVEVSNDLVTWDTVATKLGMAGLNEWSGKAQVKETSKGSYREVLVDYPSGCNGGKSFMRVRVVLD